MVKGIGAQAHFRLAAAIAVLATAFCAGAQEPQINAPFVTTPDEVVDRMLRMAQTGPADTVLDLGSGDGRIVIAAARDFGARGIGVDIDPALVALARANALRAGVGARTVFDVQDALKADLARASVVTVYLLPFLIDQLQPRFLDELGAGARIVAHAFGMKGWKPDRSETVRLARRHESQGDASVIHLWIVPAKARGEWHAHGWRLRIDQNFQEIEVEAESEGRPLAVDRAKLAGTQIEFGGAGFSYRGRVDADRMAGELTRAGAVRPLVFSRR